MDKVCAKCNGQGYVETDKGAYECECEMFRRIALSMEVAVRKAPTREAHINHPLVDKVRRDVFVVAAWSDMKAIVKVATLKHYPKSVKIISDLDIKTVFVGARSKQSHADDYLGPVYNSIEDLMDPPDLAVVVLNRLTHDNKAAAGALEEALCYRLDKAKPTWVLSDLDRPFGAGSPAYSPSLMDLLQTSYEFVTIERINQAVHQHPVQHDSPPRPEPSETRSPVRDRPPPRRIQSARDDDDKTFTVGQGVQKKKFQPRGG